VSVCSQPDVVLRNEKLQTDSSKPGKEARITGAERPPNVAQQNEAQDLKKRDLIIGT